MTRKMKMFNFLKKKNFSKGEKNSKGKKYGLLMYSSINIADEIQTVAASRFIPRIDYYIRRERTDRFKPNDKGREIVKLIMNGWWMWEPSRFPPSACIDPLFISFCLKKDIDKNFFTETVVDYMKVHGPVGCRDAETVELFEKNGVDAYFTGCLTSTFTPNLCLREKWGRDYILCVDVPDKLFRELEKIAQKPVYNISCKLSPCFTSEKRRDMARLLLFLLNNAYCVITTGQLEIALSCTALQTPVCVLGKKEDFYSGSFSGYEGLFVTVDPDEFTEDPSLYDINNPPPNLDGYMGMAESLAGKCRAFTGYDSQKPVLEDDYNPMLELAGIIGYDKKALKRSLLFLDKKEIVNIVDDKFEYGLSKRDLTI